MEQQYVAMPMRHLVYDQECSSFGWVLAGVPLMFESYEQGQQYLRQHASSYPLYSRELQRVCGIPGFMSDIVEVDWGHCEQGRYHDYLVLMPLLQADDSRVVFEDMWHRVQSVCPVGHCE